VEPEPKIPQSSITELEKLSYFSFVVGEEELEPSYISDHYNRYAH
jgi:hypothetical protein